MNALRRSVFYALLLYGLCVVCFECEQQQHRQTVEVHHGW